MRAARSECDRNDYAECDEAYSHSGWLGASVASPQNLRHLGAAYGGPKAREFETKDAFFASYE